jgi:hypothetical protein
MKKPTKPQPPSTFLEVRAHGYYEGGRSFIRESFPSPNEYVLEGELEMLNNGGEGPHILEAPIMVPFTAHYRLGRPRFEEEK